MCRFVCTVMVDAQLLLVDSGCCLYLKKAEMAIACNGLHLLTWAPRLECSGQATDGVRHIENGAVL